MVRVPRDLSRLYRVLPEETPRGEGEAARCAGGVRNRAASGKMDIQ